MSETYSEDDAVLQARLSLLEAEKTAKHPQEWVIIADRWMALADLLRKNQ